VSVDGSDAEMTSGSDDSRSLSKERRRVGHVFQDEVRNRKIDAGVGDRPRMAGSQEAKLIDEAVLGRRGVRVYADDLPAPSPQCAQIATDSNGIFGLGPASTADIERHPGFGKQLVHTDVKPDGAVKIREATKSVLRVKAFTKREGSRRPLSSFAVALHARRV
jgi:hypothetical protein